MPDHQRALFGTDGVRGVANIEPVTAETALRLGRAAAHVITGLNRHPRNANAARATIVVGKDTRQSGYMLESALVAGITSLGADVLLLGPLPTPGVAYITRSLRADAGVVLSASHNPYEDNGIKFFRHDGYKLDDDLEKRIEDLVFTGEIDSIRPTADRIGRAKRIDDAIGRYVEQAKSSFPRGMTLESIKIAVDAGNGAAYKSTPSILRELGADVAVINDRPDGTNINAGCGSTHPEAIRKFVLETGAMIGITHDGDADRALLCDEKGEIVDGDEILAIAATAMIPQGRLAGNCLVATVMSNFGLDEALSNAGGTLRRTPVGDRHVIAEMLRHGLNVGGEQSGHMIFRDFATTGDGIVSALQILAIMAETGKPLSELKRCLTKYPQAQRNLRVKSKPALDDVPGFSGLRTEVERDLANRGRILIRYSGTEPKVRILVEGPDQVTIDRHADRLAETLQSSIGA